MQGNAKLFLENELKVHTYAKFKQIMLAEFGDVMNSANVHELLSKWRIVHDETIDEF